MPAQTDETTKWSRVVDSSLGQNVLSIDAIGATATFALIVSIGMWRSNLITVVTPLYAELALGGAILAVSLTVLSVFAAISSDDYLALVSASVGMKEAMRPYRVIAFVSGALIIESLLGVIVWSIAYQWSKVFLVAIGTALSVWAVIGTCQLVKITMEHVELRTQMPEIRTARREAIRQQNSETKTRP